MKICFVAPANNYHTKKWATWFSKRDHEVHVVSFIKDDILGAKVHFIDTGVNAEDSDSSKIKYLLHAKKLKKIVDEINPDIVNVHYATSYGTVAALSGIKQYVLSVWGSDIYDFPKRSMLHKIMLKFSLCRATWLFSTSKAMAEEAGKYTKKRFKITPFGVDMDLFNPDKRTRSDDDNLFVIGTVKSLSKVYGIEYILKAAALIKKHNPEIPLRVRIAGKGNEELYYKDLAKKLGINDIVDWLGFISQEQAAVEWANMDVAVIPSISYESFGVAAVEAQACATPVIVTAVGGLMETTLANESSFIIPVKNESAITEKIIVLYNDAKLRRKMGNCGRINAKSKYELNYCFEKIERIYYHLIRI